VPVVHDATAVRQEARRRPARNRFSVMSETQRTSINRLEERLQSLKERL
jgi:hypothetical protein